VQRLSLEAELRRALERDEFTLHYQPIFDVVSGAVVGAEALVRWNSARGMIGPNEFISIAEETRVIFELGAWVLLTACTQAIEWQLAGLPLRMAVNLSPRQFLQPDLLQIVSGALDKTGLPPQLLALEITESMLMHQHESIPDTLSCLNRLGIRIAIDDFGTGYSSLSYLKRFQVQELKIDRSFVLGLPANADDAAIVTAIASMAKSLGMRLIVEGVESEAQLAFVRRLGCDAVQGFLSGMPVPAEEFARRFIEAQTTASMTAPD
jgi:EAL domain-containing protein (putative c-di-GMP-specific phosphodiesterase class I)